MKNLDMFLGKTISNVTITDDDKVKFIFTDNTIMLLCDTERQCCEERYFTTYDDLTSYAGDTLIDVILKSYSCKHDYSPNKDNTNHDIQFVEVVTNKSCITFASHNEHNGYYSGIDIELLVG